MREGGQLAPGWDPQFRESLREAWQRRTEEKRVAEEERRLLAMAKARAVAELLKVKYRVKRAYLFGSLAWGSHFSDRSDIDILIEGFPSNYSYWDMWLDAERLAEPFSISLVLAETAVPGLREKAVKEGVPL